MGTRCTVKFYNEFDKKEGKPIVCVYHQYDGYIEGVGYDLANFLKDKKVVNGYNDISRGENIANRYANGMGCLAAQYIAASKKKIGGVYITTIDDAQQYNYHVRLINNIIEIQVDDKFNGTADELLEFNEIKTMGIKSTFTISRHVAEEIITKKIMTDISELTDRQLADILESFPESYYRNYEINGVDYNGNHDFVIEDFYDFKYKP